MNAARPRSDGDGDLYALEARDLAFTFPLAARPALDQLALRVRAGSFTGLLGPNGAGKTTLVNLVSGLLTAEAGSLRVFGRSIAEREARRAIGSCPQELALYPTLTAAENLRFFGRLSGLRGARLSDRVEACLAIARLVAEADRRVERFSGGMKRRLNLGVALLHEPRLLLLDEPTVGVDAPSRLAIFGALEALNASGTTILYTTHHMAEVERLCDEVIVIDHGRVLAAGTTAQVCGARAPSFRLTLGAGASAAALAAEAETAGLRTRVLGENELELTSDDLAALTSAVARLVAGGGVLACETVRPSLEQRFLALTGEELRD